MPKKRNTKLKALDVAVIIFCLLGSGLCLWLFWRDINKTLSKSGETPIATITFKKKAAQRKFTDRVIWDRLQKESPIWNGDTIRTSERSEATIPFEDAVSKLLFDENTLAQIFWNKKDGANIEFSGGGVSIDSTGSTGAITLTSGGNAVRFEAGSVATLTGADGGMDLVLIAGNASVNGRVVEEGGAFSLDASGGVEAVPAVAMSSPSPGKRYLCAEDAVEIAFAWREVNFEEGMETMVEVARSRSFSDMVSSGLYAGRELSLALPPGEYYWRAAPQSAAQGQSGKSVQGKFTVIAARPPEPLTPPDGAAFSYSSRLPKAGFSWTAVEDADSYLLEIADNPAMNSPALSTAVSVPAFTTALPGDGKWYWRVRPAFDGSEEALPSRTASLTVTKSEEFPAPALLNPLETGEVNSEAKSYFSWGAMNDAQSYNIVVSSRENLSSPVIDKNVPTNYYVSDALTEGTWYWAVSAQSPDGKTGPRSAVRSFNAGADNEPLRTIFPPDNYTADTGLLPGLRFTYRSSLDGENRFQVSDKDDFSTLLADKATSSRSSSIETNLAEGRYYWRITAKSPSGEEIVSQVKSFTAAGLLPAPAPVKPAPDSYLVFRTGENTNISWRTVPGAAYYQARIFRQGAEGRAVYQNAAVAGTSFELDTANVNDGGYVLSLQASSPETRLSTRRSGEVSRSSFQARRVTPVTLISPASGEVISGRAARKPVSLRWSSELPAVNARLTVYDGARVLLDLANPPQVVEIPSIGEGRWNWTVTAETVDRYDISAVRPAFFTVLPAARFPAPANMRPENGRVFGREYLAENAGISLAWDGVEGATHYIVSVVPADGGPPVIEGREITQTSFDLNDLHALRRGVFSWRVEAVAKDDEGEVEQEGNAGESGFTIDIPAVVRPAGKDPGVLYGF
jgi:hypothetical protein